MFKTLSFIIIIVSLSAGSSTLLAQEKEMAAPEVVSYSEWTLHDNSQAEAFKKALSDFLQVLNASFPGVRWELYRADRGPNIGKYIAITTFDTKARRDSYFPQEGKMSDAFGAIWNRPGIQEKWKIVEQYISNKWLGDLIIIK